MFAVKDYASAQVSVAKILEMRISNSILAILYPCLRKLVRLCHAHDRAGTAEGNQEAPQALFAGSPAMAGNFQAAGNIWRLAPILKAYLQWYAFSIGASR